MNERRLSVLVFSLFFSWLLAFPFEGQVLYALAAQYEFAVSALIFGCISAHFLGLFACGFFVRSMQAAKKIMLISIAFCFAVSGAFFLPPSILWLLALPAASLLAGICVGAWGFYYKSFTPANERIKTAADGLIYSNILMIVMNMAAIYLLPHAGLALSMLALAAAFFFVLRLPAREGSDIAAAETSEVSPGKPLAFLCLFIVIITINSGLMYQVLNPAFAHHQWLVSWYWAVPYIIALFIMRNLPAKASRAYLLYVGIAMIGLSFLAFMILDRSAVSYLIVDTLMLGACGIYDLFWWSILGEMLDFGNNPAKILGIGLSANVLGVLLGGLLGQTITGFGAENVYSSAIALSVAFIILIILPLLHKQLSRLLQNHVYLTEMNAMPPLEQEKAVKNVTLLANLTERESEIAALLMGGRTYKMIADELFLSENTVKTHIKNIYSKLSVNNKTELIKLLLDKS